VNDVLHHVIENARRDSQHVALKDADGELTYGQLIEHAGRAAAALSTRGVASGDRVVLLLQNSIDYVIAALASLWIGAIFVPLDTTDPVQRLASLMRDCRPATVLTNGVLDETAWPEDLDTSMFMSVTQLLGDATETAPALPIGERPSYMIYTSGTTGTPRGVTVGSSAFEAGVSSSCDALGLGPTTRTLSVAPFHFDGSFATLFTTLVCGGTLIIRPRESLLFPRVFFKTIIAESVTYTGFTPSYLRGLESDPQFDQLATSDLKVIALGGEACSVGDVERIWSVMPRMRIFNRYGPTETIIAVTHIELNPSIVARGVVPIGKPHPGVRFYLVNDSGRLIDEPDIAGELYIGGRQLMDGYWNSPELTAKVLRTDIVKGQRLYRTGDIVYLDSDGDYVYVDRVDRVIKRSGVRISLLEVTDAFRKITAVSAATSIAFDNDGTLGIATFLVVSSDVSRADLHRRARDLLPASMLPDRIEVVGSIPITPSGKTDERTLLSGAVLVPLSKPPVE
jgi:amino acid adenylation domain-containing protein